MVNFTASSRFSPGLRSRDQVSFPSSSGLASFASGARTFTTIFSFRETGTWSCTSTRAAVRLLFCTVIRYS